jgi:hypothetical protein
MRDGLALICTFLVVFVVFVLESMWGVIIEHGRQIPE